MLDPRLLGGGLFLQFFDRGGGAGLLLDLLGEQLRHLEQGFDLFLLQFDLGLQAVDLRRFPGLGRGLGLIRDRDFGPCLGLRLAQRLELLRGASSSL